MSNNNKGKTKAMPQKPANVLAQMTITAFSDRPPDFHCTGNIVTALRLLSVGLQTVARTVQQQTVMKDRQADPVDKKRKYLGPREPAKVYGEE